MTTATNADLGNPMNHMISRGSRHHADIQGRAGSDADAERNRIATHRGPDVGVDEVVGVRRAAQDEGECAKSKSVGRGGEPEWLSTKPISAFHGTETMYQ